MTSSLVGSEMCIRDRCYSSLLFIRDQRSSRLCLPEPSQLAYGEVQVVPVSYTHLTLPTICSV
eukprot:1864636-Prorocentrum_lima.AAC.1